jgi:hypothetical protein
MTAVGQLAIETMDAELLASRRESRGLALSLLKPNTAEKVKSEDGAESPLSPIRS